MSVKEGESTNGESPTIQGLIEDFQAKLDLDTELDYVRFLNHDMIELKMNLEKVQGADEESQQIFKKSVQGISNQLFKDLDLQKRTNYDMLVKLNKLGPIVGDEVIEDLDVDSTALDEALTKDIPRIVPDRLDLMKDLDQGKYSYMSNFSQLMTKNMPKRAEETEELIRRRENAEQALLDILETKLNDLDDYCRNQEEDKRHVTGEVLDNLDQEFDRISRPALRNEKKWINEFSQAIDNVSETCKYLLEE